MDQPQDKTTMQTDPRRPGAASILGSQGVLVVLSRNLFGRSHVIAGPTTIVGRQDEADFAIPDPLMSRRHFRLTMEKGEFWVEDLGSTNGTTLNARKLEKRSRILYGDRLVAGSTIFRFFVEEDVEKK
jgi:pSer/pThr/pTyr-binding forkhead associated (FHA) protein